MRNTASSVIKGKYSYMAPEQVEAEELDYRVDIFSAGIILYELITATRLFEAETDLGVLSLVRRARVPVPSSVAPGLPPELDRICLRALARDPKQRYPSASRLQADLERFCFKSSFGRQQLGRFMKKAFSKEQDKKRLFIREAREEFQARFDAASTNVLSPGEVEDLGSIPTLDVEPDDTVPSAPAPTTPGAPVTETSIETPDVSEDALIPAGPEAHTITSNRGSRTASTTTMASGEWPLATDAVPALPAPRADRPWSARTFAVAGLVVAALVVAISAMLVMRDGGVATPARETHIPASSLSADSAPLKAPAPDMKPSGPRAAPGWSCAEGMKAPCLMEQPVTLSQWRKIATKKDLEWDTGTSPSAAAVYLPHVVCQTYCQRLGFRLPTDSELKAQTPASVPGSGEPLQEWTGVAAGKGRWWICAGKTCRKQGGSDRQTDIGFRCAADRVVE